jgi:predicted AAA+ superfamily ATPase
MKMESRDVLDIAQDWSSWDGDIPESVPRDVSLPESLRDSLCLVVQGVRRCGKSTLLHQLVDLYGLNPRHCVFLNFEDPRLANDLNYETLEALVRGFRDEHSDVEKLYFFLDEIQGVTGWEKWVRSKLDRPKGDHFVITGSNSTLLSGDLGSVLTGRHLTIELFPFSFAEAGQLRDDLSVEEYLSAGGFPEPLRIGEDGDQLLRQYFDDIVERDIREHVGSRSAAPIRRMIQMAYESAGSELSMRRAASAVGVAVDTATGYMDSAESAYLVERVPYFAFSERKRQNRNSKYYPIDHGMRRAVVRPSSQDRGKTLECAVLLELRRHFDEVCYWRGKREVDFVVETGGEVVPIQVTWREPQERHRQALDEFYEAFPRSAEARFVTVDNFADIETLVAR